jgi:endonuclease YncB( thermonuclease family)
MRLLLIFLFVVLATGGRAADIPSELSGPARVVDGNTIEIAGARIRLHGVKAPALDQSCETRRGKPYRCGVAARTALADLLRGRTVRCKATGRDGSGGMIAKCFIEWLDIGEQMVLIGRALADRDRSTDYVRAENAARALKEGMWKGRLPPLRKEMKD